MTSLQLAGFPHSDIKGSIPACGSPLLFAACHVLLRRLVPWHPPCALLRLITSILRLRYIFSGQLTFNLQLVFQDFFLVFFSVQLSRCAVNSFTFRISFQNPENDTDDWFDSSFLGRLWLLAFAPFLRPVSRTLSFRNFRSRFRFVIDLGLKPRLPAWFAP